MEATDVALKARVTKTNDCCNSQRNSVYPKLKETLPSLQTLQCFMYATNGNLRLRNETFLFPGHNRVQITQTFHKFSFFKQSLRASASVITRAVIVNFALRLFELANKHEIHFPFAFLLETLFVNSKSSLLSIPNH